MAIQEKTFPNSERHSSYSCLRSRTFNAEFAVVSKARETGEYNQLTPGQRKVFDLLFQDTLIISAGYAAELLGKRKQAISQIKKRGLERLR